MLWRHLFIWGLTTSRAFFVGDVNIFGMRLFIQIRYFFVNNRSVFVLRSLPFGHCDGSWNCGKYLNMAPKYNSIIKNMESVVGIDSIVRKRNRLFKKEFTRFPNWRILLQWLYKRRELWWYYRTVFGVELDMLRDNRITFQAKGA